MIVATATRKQRLRTLENQIRKNYEQFVHTGFALKEIRDDELYKEDGFDTWEQYLKDRVGEQFGIERTQAFQLILCAQVRPKLPAPLSAAPDNDDGKKPEWTQSVVKEFARLAPKADAKGAPYDIDRLKKNDVERVANKAIKHCEEKGVKLTSAVVKRFVDQDLGIPEQKAKVKAETAKKQTDPNLHVYMRDYTGSIEGMREALEAIPRGGWKWLREEHPGLIKRLVKACDSLASFLREVEG